MRLRPPRLTRRFAITILIALVVLSLDTITKEIARGTLEVGDRRPVIPNLLVFTHVQNTGAAYGLLAGQRWLLVLTAAATALLTPLLLRALPIGGRWGWAAPVLTGLILGGAAGNLIERAAVGYVTDFIQVPLVPLFQVFNLSDASISVAITALIVLSLVAGEGKPGEAPASPVDGRPVEAGASADAEPRT
ncbi:MAG: signal peptidase II [Dehalococcoidia bacterium]